MAAWVRSRLNSASRLDSRWRCCCGCLLLRHAGQLFANLRKLQAALLQNLGGEALLFAQQTQEQMLGADVLVAQPLGFFGRIGQHALALVRKRQVDAGRDLFANGGVRLDLLADRLHRGVRAQEAVG